MALTQMLIRAPLLILEVFKTLYLMSIGVTCRSSRIPYKNNRTRWDVPVKRVVSNHLYFEFEPCMTDKSIVTFPTIATIIGRARRKVTFVVTIVICVRVTCAPTQTPILKASTPFIFVEAVCWCGGSDGRWYC